MIEMMWLLGGKQLSATNEHFVDVYLSASVKEWSCASDMSAHWLILKLSISRVHIHRTSSGTGRVNEPVRLPRARSSGLSFPCCFNRRGVHSSVLLLRWWGVLVLTVATLTASTNAPNGRHLEHSTCRNVQTGIESAIDALIDAVRLSTCCWTVDES